jgi:integrase/recombinase XerC
VSVTASSRPIGERLTAWPIAELIEPYVSHRSASGQISSQVARTLRSELRRFVDDVGPNRRGGAVSVREATAWARESDGQRESQGRRLRTAIAFLDWVHADGQLPLREPSALQVVLVSPVAEEATSATTVAGLIDAYLRQRVRRRDLSIFTARNHRSALRLFAAVMGDRDPSSISRADVEQWLETRAGRRPSTARSQFSYLRTFFTWLVENEHLVRNPCDGMKAPRVPRPAPRAMQEDAVTSLLDVCPDERAKAIVWLMAGMALRCCEVERLRVRDWDQKARTMLVRGKRDDERIIPVPDVVAWALQSYLAVYPPVGDLPLIRTYRRPNQPLRADTISGMVSGWMDAAGLKTGARDGMSAHALRHTCASQAFERSKDLRVAQELLGHTNLAVTSRYIRPAGLDAMREALSSRADEETSQPLAAPVPLDLCLVHGRRVPR